MPQYSDVPYLNGFSGIAKYMPNQDTSALSNLMEFGSDPSSLYKPMPDGFMNGGANNFLSMGDFGKAPNVAASRSFFDSFDASGNKIQGYGGAAVGIGAGVLQGAMGLKSLRLQEAALANGKAQFAASYTGQQRMTNAHTEAAQNQARREYAANGHGTMAETTAQYMDKHGIPNYGGV